MIGEATPRRVCPDRHLAPDAFGVSVPTSAVRFVELTDIACTVVLSEAGLVRWSAPHAAFSGSVAFRRHVDQRSLAWDYFQRGTLCAGVEHVPAAAWLNDAAEGPLLEHSIASHERGTVLTLLSLPAHHRAHLAA